MSEQCKFANAFLSNIFQSIFRPDKTEKYLKKNVK